MQIAYLLTEKLLRELKREPADQDVWDSRCRGLVLRCRASGRHSYRFQVRRGHAITIGSLDDFTPDQAREEADKLRGDVARGKDPAAERRAAHSSSLDRFLDTEYGPWVKANRKTGAETLSRLRATFPTFLGLPLGAISVPLVERWRTARLESGVSPSTVNRDLASLRSVLTRAVEFGVLQASPMAKVKASKVDAHGIVRFLSAAEEKRLRIALEARDDTRRGERERANEWRRVRGYDVWPAFGTYTDHLTPLVLLAINTGLRRGELFNLKWEDIELDAGRLTVRGDGTKSGQTRVVPLNREAVKVLRVWRSDEPDRTGPVFAGNEGDPITEIKSSFLRLMRNTKIVTFRFHDLRHHFASRLVQAGVDLNTVRELLGHADLKMTLRYAHLAPEHRAAAVEKLVAS